MKKGTVIKVKVKVMATKDELPDWGLGKGILAEQEVTIDEDVTEENKVRFGYKMQDIYKALLDSTVVQVFEVIETKQDNG